MITVSKRMNSNTQLREYDGILLLTEDQHHKILHHNNDARINLLITNGQSMNNLFDDKLHITSETTINLSIPTLKQNHQLNQHNTITNDFYSQHMFVMFEHISQGMIVTSSEGKIIYCNQEALILLNKKIGYLLHHGHDRMFDNISIANGEIIGYYEKLSKHLKSILHVSFINHVGEQKHYVFITSYSEQINCYLTNIIDETEKHHWQLEMDTQRHLKQLGQVSAMVVHEIRNPLTTIKGFLQLIKEPLNKDIARYLEIMDSELIRMEHLMEDILYYARMHSEPFELVCFEDLVEEVFEILKPEATNKKIQLQFFMEKKNQYQSYGNKYRLIQMLINLMRNAMDVSEGSKIIVQLLPKNNNTFEMRVKDFGEGMTEEIIEKIMQPFFTTKSHGTGLGLPIVKKILENHQIELTIKSALNKGTCFNLICKQHFESTIFDKAF